MSSASKRLGRGSSNSYSQSDEVTSTYRSTYGGPRGATMDDWKSTSSCTGSQRLSQDTASCRSDVQYTNKKISQKIEGGNSDAKTTGESADRRKKELHHSSSMQEDPNEALSTAPQNKNDHGHDSLILEMHSGLQISGTGEENAGDEPSKQFKEDGEYANKLHSHSTNPSTVMTTTSTYSQISSDISSGYVGSVEESTSHEQILNAALQDISTLTIGHKAKHTRALKSLVATLKKHSTSPSIRGEIHNAGGTYILQTNISSANVEQSILCAEGLVEMSKDPKAKSELSDMNEEATCKLLISAALQVKEGNKTFLELLGLLVNIPNRYMKQASAQTRLVPTFLEHLSKCTRRKVYKGPEIESIMEALVAMMNSESNLYFVDSFIWNGGIETINTILCESDSIEAKSRALRLLFTAAESRKDCIALLCYPTIIEALSLLLDDDCYPICLQIEASSLLHQISSLSKKKQEVKDALMDHCLPRICEILHQSKTHITQGEHNTTDALQSRLWRICASILSHLARDSALCCQTIIFQTNLLEHSVLLLNQARQYKDCKILLQATYEYAKCPLV
eukprot:jgi/Picsp_1/1613/NSC_05091-R1_hypothetical protein CHLNCDRAFT_140051 [Chlorella variabilis]